MAAILSLEYLFSTILHTIKSYLATKKLFWSQNVILATKSYSGHKKLFWPYNVVKQNYLAIKIYIAIKSYLAMKKISGNSLVYGIWVKV